MAGQEFDDEVGKGMRVFIHSVERLFLFSAPQMAEAGARCVDKDQVAGIQQTVFIVDELVGSRRAVRIILGEHSLGPESPHVKPHAG